MAIDSLDLLIISFILGEFLSNIIGDLSMIQFLDFILKILFSILILNLPKTLSEKVLSYS
jgi:hypothetical protein